MSIDDKLNINEVLEELDKLKIETEVGKEYLIKAKEIVNYIGNEKTKNTFKLQNESTLSQKYERIFSLLENIFKITTNEIDEIYTKDPKGYIDSLYKCIK